MNARISVHERRTEEKQRRRDEILEVADRLFRQSGFHETSIDKIAHEASLGKGTVYYYYENKEQTLTDLFERRLRASVRQLSGELRNVQGLQSSMLTTARAALAFLTEHMASLHLMLREGGRFAGKCPQAWHQLNGLRRGLRRLAIRWMQELLAAEQISVPADLILEMLISMVMGAAHQHFFPQKDQGQLLQRFDEAIQILYGGLSRPVHLAHPPAQRPEIAPSETHP